MSFEQEPYIIGGSYTKVNAAFCAGNHKDVNRTIGHLRNVLFNVQKKLNTHWNYGGFKISFLKYGSKTIINRDDPKTFESLAAFDSFYKFHSIPLIEFN